MDMYKQPSGVKDYLPEERITKSNIANNIMQLFYSHAYVRVETPVIEYYNLYNKADMKVEESKVFKLSDNDGRLLVLRPDITLPITRLVATKVKPEGILKYCYMGKSYRLNSDSRYGLREFTQAGIELLGDNSAYANVDAIALAIESLQVSGLSNFIIDIGHVGFFNGLISSLGLSDKVKDDIARHIYNKNLIGLKSQIERSVSDNISEISSKDRSVIEIIEKLPKLFGDISICDIDKKFELDDTSQNALDELRQLDSLLEARGLNQYVSYDLSLVNSMNYYTGIVFNGITKNYGAPILAGGRYDNLSKSFGEDIPAIGFAIGIDTLVEALLRSGRPLDINVVDFVIGYDYIGYEKGIETANKLRQEGYIVDTTLAVTQEALIEYTKKRNINCNKIIFICDKVEKK